MNRDLRVLGLGFGFGFGDSDSDSMFDLLSKLGCTMRFPKTNWVSVPIKLKNIFLMNVFMSDSGKIKYWMVYIVKQGPVRGRSGVARHRMSDAIRKFT